MKSKGIRIEGDKEKRILSVGLSDILAEIHDGDTFNWAILDIDALEKPGKGRAYKELESQVKDSTHGFFISWSALNALSNKFHQIIWVTILGCKDKSLVRYYEDIKEMFETCDIVIELVDSGYWEVFSKDIDLIDRLAAKFKSVEFLATDYEQ